MEHLGSIVLRAARKGQLCDSFLFLGLIHYAHVKSRWQRLRAVKNLSLWQLYESYTLLTQRERTGTKSRIWHCNSIHSIYIGMKREKNLLLTSQSTQICFPALHGTIQWLVIKLFIFLILCHSMCWVSGMGSCSLFSKMDLDISRL